MRNKRKIFFAHSAGEQDGKGKGSFDLVAHLRAALGEDYEVLFPVVNEPDSPAYHHWKTMLDHEFSKTHEPVILVGHSLGGSVLLKYLSEEQTNLHIEGMFLVATPQWNKDGWDMSEWAVKKDFTKRLPPVREYYFYHCLEDPIVSIEHLLFYRKVFKNAIFRELPCKDHGFSNGLKELADDIRLTTGDN
ncbi:alpha/beta fold hydrolase [Mucilaginibacter sabulilitoris]|uniref:Alpha/beta fold hydrolase n=1 Tax=Mucilaginibacter sabulilitoris TaxID=1173583 RepID=A0ABZ0TKV6_9SPHI|nr:alpha/beta fold hydrolase [Mucilaginibacter sabulilitoris]WPU93436.1 alpha/beta fold hydrolase [Mucilaginibacter sabulilitoris]